MAQRYNVYFAGQLLEGHQLVEVRAKLAKLFNADEQTLARLFSGKAQLLKRDCDEATAIKYKQAMERAGAAPVVRRSEDSQAPQSTGNQAPRPAAPQPATPQPATPPPMTAAERIAALAAAPDENRFREEVPESGINARQPPPPEPGDPEVAPVGSDLLRAQDRSDPVVAEVDTSGLEVGEALERLSPVPPAPPPAPDTAHLDLGAAGEVIPGLPVDPPPPVPDSGVLDVAPVGADIGPPGDNADPGPVPDLSGIDLAPAGSEVLEEKYRRHDVPPAPATDHLSLDD